MNKSDNLKKNYKEQCNQVLMMAMTGTMFFID